MARAHASAKRQTRERVCRTDKKTKKAKKTTANDPVHALHNLPVAQLRQPPAQHKATKRLPALADMDPAAKIHLLMVHITNLEESLDTYDVVIGAYERLTGSLLMGVAQDDDINKHLPEDASEFDVDIPDSLFPVVRELFQLRRILDRLRDIVKEDAKTHEEATGLLVSKRIHNIREGTLNGKNHADNDEPGSDTSSSSSSSSE